MQFFEDIVQPEISGERFNAIYTIYADDKTAYEMAQDICYEQTVEFPRELVPKGSIQEGIVGRIEAFDKVRENIFQACISYAIETAAMETTQFINVLFGNISIKPGIQLSSISLSPSLYGIFHGPRFGIDGIRSMVGVYGRPLLSTALKPMGLSARDLGSLAYQFALGGIDIIKDDHGISNQQSSFFDERVKYCVEAVNRANAKTGERAIYVANVTAPTYQIMERAIRAKELGAGGLLIAPGITGIDVVVELSKNPEVKLPIIAHPAFQGSYVLGESGVSHFFMFGQLPRLMGADASIYPNYGGRFSFSQAACESIVSGTSCNMDDIQKIFPCPGGGLSLDLISKLSKVYGEDVIYLVGGGLFKYGNNLVESCQHFRKIISGE